MLEHDPDPLAEFIQERIDEVEGALIGKIELTHANEFISEALKSELGIFDPFAWSSRLDEF